MTHIYRTIGSSIEQSLLELANTRNVYEPKTWHAQNLPKGSKMIELLNHSFISQVPITKEDAQAEIIINEKKVSYWQGGVGAQTRQCGVLQL